MLEVRVKFSLKFPWQKQHLRTRKFFHQKTGPKFKEETKNATLEQDIVWCWNLHTSVSRSENTWNVWNVVLEEDGENQLDRSFEKWINVTNSQVGEEYPTNNNKKEG